MGAKSPRRRVSRSARIETLEDRQMFSVDPLGGLMGGSIQHHSFVEEPVLVQHDLPSLGDFGQRDADFWIDSSTERDIDQLLGDIEQSLSSGHDLTGWKQVRQDYGFTGIGQTVAVIDSGIAYDHWALGGGFGSSYRVVGGWDFTEENDSNPYDDGPSGSHGTHVSGIIGGDRTGTNDDGVAPGVDLVGLRVFNDAGAGYFSWVENALDWVHTNRNSFANPITAVNLSLGVVSWNSSTIPSWAMLENEFAQLEADGIFISVSAGNSFTSYNSPGLSYPAASSHVVPVMSVDDNGALSYFSQRHTRAIGAPGRTIVSTVPDYAGNNNGVTDDFASYSGTSMSAPYVAGASVLVREAMQFVGQTNIDQWTIYDHMMATADTFYDSATSTNYQRLNLESAIDALIPTDDYGSTTINAFNIGTVSGNGQVSGLIGKLDDADFFEFTAGATGTVTFTATTTHQLATAWAGSGTASGNTYSIDVVAGQTYTVGLSTSDGLGYYDLDYSVVSSGMTIKTITRGDGAVFSLDSDGWLSVNGVHAWSNTYDFTLAADETLYWHGYSGYLGRRLNGGAWETLDRDTTKFAVDDAGVAYSLGQDGWLSIDGRQVWSNTEDFALVADQTIYWQGGGGQLYHRLSNGSWVNTDSGVTKFAARDNGTAYSIGDDGWLNINGRAVWGGTNDFALTEDDSLYWHSTGGSLYKLPIGGSWQALGGGVSEFAVRHDGVVYALTDSGDIRVDGVATWSNIVDIRADNTGNLEVEQNLGTLSRIAGRFITGGDVPVGGQSVQAAAGQEGSSGAAVSTTSLRHASVGDPTSLAAGSRSRHDGLHAAARLVSRGNLVQTKDAYFSNYAAESDGARLDYRHSIGDSRGERDVADSFAKYGDLLSIDKVGSQALADELIETAGKERFKGVGLNEDSVDHLFAQIGV